MKKFLIPISAGLAAVPLLLAGEDSRQGQPDTKAAESRNERSPGSRYQKINAGIFAAKLQASDLTSAPVRDQSGKIIGSVLDLELDNNGRISALYIELNDGVLCLFGNSIVRVDYDSFEIDPHSGKLRIKAHLDEEFQNFVTTIDARDRDSDPRVND